MYIPEKPSCATHVCPVLIIGAGKVSRGLPYVTVCLSVHAWYVYTLYVCMYMHGMYIHQYICLYVHGELLGLLVYMCIHSKPLM